MTDEGIDKPKGFTDHFSEEFVVPQIDFTIPSTSSVETDPLKGLSE